MHILLTGGAGYIGTHVMLCCLEAGHSVTVIDDFSNSSPKAIARVEALAGRRVTFHQGDIRDAALLDRVFQESKIDTVLHFAGLKAVNESVENPLSYYDVNVGGTIALAQAMGRAGVFRLVFSSTASVYGEQEKMPLTESSPIDDPTSPYGRSKRMVEQILEDHCASDPRWAVAVLRYFNPAGAHISGQIGEDPRGAPANLIPYATQVAIGQRAALSVFGNDYPTPDGTGVRDYIHVMDLAAGHLMAVDYLRRHKGYRIWNLGTGRGHSVLQIVQELENIIGKPLPVNFAQRRSGDIAQCWADPARAERELGWRAQHDLNEMLADHWRWQKLNPKGYDS